MKIATLAPRLALCGLLGLCAAAPALAADDAFPSRPIHLIVPFSAGGQFDFLARLVAKPMSKNLGQSIIVENVGGAGGNVGGAKVAASKPDGYTLLEYGGNFAIAKYLSPGLSYDPVADLEPVGAISIAPHVILASKSLPAKTFKDMVAYAKANPGKLSYGSPGVGTSMHLTFEEVRKHFGFQATQIPYRGGSNMLNDLAGGQIGVGIVAVAPALPFIQSGKIRAMAVTGKERAPSLPDVPTISELGYQGFDSGSWAGIAVPKGTPQKIVDRLNQAINAALHDPEVLQRFHELSFQALPGTPEQFHKMIDEEAQRYGPVVKALHLVQK
ncbi:Bug family tripartite tricarboxylate transporter substrate binding protein [Candidimonas nitroreducens]|nr:tripartite tricarboxylate transporter substrate binding protein [Candidimonas nitroreducens]